MRARGPQANVHRSHKSKHMRLMIVNNSILYAFASFLFLCLDFACMLYHRSVKGGIVLIVTYANIWYGEIKLMCVQVHSTE